jgi:hypothetical protein
MTEHTEYEAEPTGYCACGGQRWTEAGTGRYRGIASYRCDGCGVLFAGCGYPTLTEALVAKRLIDGPREGE